MDYGGLSKFGALHKERNSIKMRAHKTLTKALTGYYKSFHESGARVEREIRRKYPLPALLKW
jgi:hypothetical protein